MRKYLNIQNPVISLCLMVTCIISTPLRAQDPQFSQFYANSLYLNPGFTGNTTQFRLATTYRNQWTALPKSYISFTAAADYNFEKAKSGVGILFVKDKSGSGGLGYDNVGLSYANFIQLSRTVAIRPGIRIAYAQYSVNQNNFTFADQIARDNAANSVENIDNRVSYLDFSSGAVLTHLEKYWIGISFDHITRPNYSLLQNDVKLPLKTSIHGGWNIEIENSSGYYTNNMIRIIAHYKSQQLWDQLDFGLYYEKDPLVFGFWYRGLPGLKDNESNLPNQDAVVLLVGVKAKDFTIGYSYDATISKLSGNSGGSHEISIIYEAASKGKKTRRRKFLVPCAKF